VRCPNRKCRQETTALLIKVSPKGKVRQGCHSCLPRQGDVNVRTGKKIWAGTDVDGVKGNREKIEAFGEKITSRAAAMRRRNPLRAVRD
jgi:hypothetical protein